MSSYTPYILMVFGIIVSFIITVWLVTMRRVVPTNEVHIIQRSNSTVSYGKDLAAGNTYYAWPVWLPILGVQIITLPVSNFSIQLDSYAAYDKDRLPMVLDVEAFFRIKDANQAAQRVHSIGELRQQLRSILEGAARSILASKDIDTIMLGRAEFGDLFTREVDAQLTHWGVETVKSIELMDIRDGNGSQVIANIMEKKKSEIDRQSREVVAENRRAAETAEIEAQRAVHVSREDAEREVGLAEAAKNQSVGIANETMQQRVNEEKKLTAEKEMEIKRVQEVKAAEITKDVEVVKAQEDRQTEIERAEGEKQKTVLISEGELAKERNAAEGIRVRGVAEADAKRQMELAPVEAQIVLAKEIGENQGYQGYLITLRQLEAAEAVGIEQANALKDADLKVIANGGTIQEGTSKLGSILSPAGGLNIGALLDSLGNTEQGAALLNKFLGPK